MRADLPILLLAAGASTRMRGRDKLMEDIDGQPLIARQAQMARAATSGPVFVTLPPRPHPRHAAIEAVDVSPVPVADADEGMAASLRAGIAALPADTLRAMILLADMPDLTVDDLRILIAATGTNPDRKVWRGATRDARPGHPIIVAASLLPEFARLSGDTGGRDILRQAQADTLLVPLPGNRARADLDTPEDWTAWRETRARSVE
ncbi:MAG: nucleotidyltransferase family protein [Marinibacterium sp.]